MTTPQSINEWIPATHLALGRAPTKKIKRSRGRRFRRRRFVQSLARIVLTHSDRCELIRCARLAHGGGVLGDFDIEGQEPLFPPMVEAELERFARFGVYDKTFWKSCSYYLTQKALNALQHAMNGNIVVNIATLLVLLLRGYGFIGFLFWWLEGNDLVFLFLLYLISPRYFICICGFHALHALFLAGPVYDETLFVFFWSPDLVRRAAIIRSFSLPSGLIFSTWALSRTARNRLVHSLNGNIFGFFGSFLFVRFVLPARLATWVMLAHIVTPWFLWFCLHFEIKPILTFQLPTWTPALPFLWFLERCFWLSGDFDRGYILAPTYIGTWILTQFPGLPRFVGPRLWRMAHGVVTWCFTVLFFLCWAGFMYNVPLIFAVAFASLWLAVGLLLLETMVLFIFTLWFAHNADDIIFSSMRLLSVTDWNPYMALNEIWIRLDPSFGSVLRSIGWGFLVCLGWPILEINWFNLDMRLVRAYGRGNALSETLVFRTILLRPVVWFCASVVWASPDSPLSDHEINQATSWLFQVFFGYPFKLWIFWMSHIMNFPMAVLDSFRVWRPAQIRVYPRTLALRFSLIALSPLIALLRWRSWYRALIWTTFLAGLMTPFLLGYALSGDLYASTLLMANHFLHPFFQTLWCQIAPIRAYFDSGFQKIASTDQPFTSFGGWLATRAIEVYLLALSPKTADDWQVTYTTGTGQASFGIRDNLPDSARDRIVLALTLYRRRNPLYQHASLTFVAVILIVWVCVKLSYRSLKYGVRSFASYLIRVTIIIISVFFLPEPLLIFLVGFSHEQMLWLKAYLDNMTFPAFETLSRLLGIAIYIGMAPNLDSAMAPLEGPSSTPIRMRLAKTLKVSSIRVGRFFDDLHIPEFVEAQWMSPDVDSIRASYQRLKDIGWPVDQEFIDSITDISDDPYLMQHASLFTRAEAVTNFVIDLVRVKLEVPPEMSNWNITAFGFSEFAGYLHSFGWNSVNAELDSTARYWTGNFQVPFSSKESRELLDDVWHVVKSQYAFSRLTSFEYVYDHWEKKFNLGFGFTSGSGRRKKMLKRRAAVNQVGGKKPFLELWARTFQYAASFIPVAPVFAKSETLKVKKMLAGQVRTIVGSAITHHIMTTVFNYFPNHNYKIWDTPMKVGMSSNGINYGRIWESLRKHEFIWAGDMTAFDSTIPEPILRLVAEVRKMGFRTHADYHKIATLIDIAYDQLLEHPLGVRSTGTIYEKKQGFTTGHSSTSPDNSLALVVVWMFAWRRVTGLRARQFVAHNTLHNFGDDHVLGWDAVYGWSPEAALRAMAELGIMMRDEAPREIRLPSDRPSFKSMRKRFELTGLGSRVNSPLAFEDYVRALEQASRSPDHRAFAFLAKMPVEKTGKVRDDLEAAGVRLPYTYATLHVRDRLVGKIKGQMRANTHPWVRRARLVAYMDLSAHHEDVYVNLKRSIEVIDNKYREMFARMGHPTLPGIPSYHDVLRRWYNVNSRIAPVETVDQLIGKADEDQASRDIDELIVSFTTPPFLDGIVSWLATFPTIISPRVVGRVWVREILKVQPQVWLWPYALVSYAQGLPVGTAGVQTAMSKTPYSWLIDEGLASSIPTANPASVLARHWFYTFAEFVLGSSHRKRAPTWFDLPHLVDTRIASIQYLLNARSTAVVYDYGLPFRSLLFVWLANFISLPSTLDHIAILLFGIYIPSSTFLIQSSFESFKKWLNPLGTVDLQPFFAATTNAIVRRTGVIISAPTGIGKSTTLMGELAGTAPLRIVVVLPRHLLVLSVTRWMRFLFPGLNIGAYTENGIRDANSDVLLYGTVQGLAASGIFQERGRSLFVLDEAHIDEPHYRVLRSWLRRRREPYVLMTATPANTWPETTVVIPAAPRFNVVTREVTVRKWGDYVKYASRLVSNDTGLHAVFLIFVSTVEQAEVLAATLPYPSFLVKSGVSEVPEGFKVYISTNVADAGLTIPGVTVVVSSDVDIFVGVERTQLVNEVDGFPVDDVRRHWTRLSDATLKQRRGRTGRTVDGVFYQVALSGVPTKAITYSLQDYINNLGPALGVFAEYIPGVADGWFAPHVMTLVREPQRWIEYQSGFSRQAMAAGQVYQDVLNEFAKLAYGTPKALVSVEIDTHLTDVGNYTLPAKDWIAEMVLPGRTEPKEASDLIVWINDWELPPVEAVEFHDLEVDGPELYPWDSPLPSFPENHPVWSWALGESFGVVINRDRHPSLKRLVLGLLEGAVHPLAVALFLDRNGGKPITQRDTDSLVAYLTDPAKPNVRAQLHKFAALCALEKRERNFVIRAIDSKVGIEFAPALEMPRVPGIEQLPLTRAEVTLSSVMDAWHCNDDTLADLLELLQIPPAVLLQLYRTNPNSALFTTRPIALATHIQVEGAQALLARLFPGIF